MVSEIVVTEVLRHNDLSWMLDYVSKDFDEDAFLANAKEKIVEKVGKMSKDGYFDLMFDFPFEFSARRRSESLTKPEILSIEDELAELYGEGESVVLSSEIGEGDSHGTLDFCAYENDNMQDFCESMIRVVHFADGFYVCKPDGDLIKADAHAIELLIETEQAHEVSDDEWLLPADALESICKSFSDINSIN